MVKPYSWTSARMDGVMASMTRMILTLSGAGAIKFFLNARYLLEYADQRRHDLRIVHLARLPELALGAGVPILQTPAAEDDFSHLLCYRNRMSDTEADDPLMRIDGRITLMQWMLALLIGGVASLLVKAFLG